MNLFDRFRERLEEPKGFGWNPEWDVLKGIELPIDFVRGLVNVDTLEEYNPDKHLNISFTGFVRADKKEIEIEGSEEMSEFLYLEKGVIRYAQCHEGGAQIYSKKFNFYNENFWIRRAYGSNEGGRLSYVHCCAKFKLDDLNVELLQCHRDNVSIYISNDSEVFFGIDAPGERTNNFSEELFNDYLMFVDSLKDLSGKILGKKGYFGKDLGFDEGVSLVRKG